MKKRLLFVLIALLTTMVTWASETGKGLVVWLNNGDKTEVLFTELPEITYEDGNVILKGTTVNLSWPIVDLQKITFADDILTGIKSVESGDLDLLSGHFDVYDLSGKIVRKDAKSLSELPKGVYIVKDGNVTIKVVRK